MQNKLLMTTSTGGNSEDYNPFYCNFWLIQREFIDETDFVQCKDTGENYPEEREFLKILTQKGYSILKLEQPDCMLFDEDE